MYKLCSNSGCDTSNYDTALTPDSAGADLCEGVVQQLLLLLLLKLFIVIIIVLICCVQIIICNTTPAQAAAGFNCMSSLLYACFVAILDDVANSM